MMKNKVGGLPEMDQILVPVVGELKAVPLLDLFGINKRMLREWSGLHSMPPIRIITQRGPQQNGANPYAMRYDPRPITFQIAEPLANRSEFWDKVNELKDLFRPTRNFATSEYTPHVYRKLLTGGKRLVGNDGQITNGDAEFVSITGRFLHYGGLEAGCSILIEGVRYEIASIPNDYTLILDSAYAGSTTTTASWNYFRGQAIRELEFSVDGGPDFNQGNTASPFIPTGYREVIRATAHNPFWQGVEQIETWGLESLGDLVFDGEGAWFGYDEGEGRWLFAPDSVNDTTEVVYWGTQLAKPIISITGPAVNPSASNNSINVTITSSLNIPEGVTVTIDTGALTVKDNFGNRLDDQISGPLSLFGLSPDVPDRINEIQISFDGATPLSRAQLTWRNLYV